MLLFFCEVILLQRQMDNNTFDRGRQSDTFTAPHVSCAVTTGNPRKNFHGLDICLVLEFGRYFSLLVNIEFKTDF